VELRFSCSPSTPGEAAESITLATFVFARDGGSLACTDDGSHIVLRLPLSAT